MASWQPEYWQESMSNERLAEVVLKLEREIYRIKRPAQLARREVHLRVATPIKLTDFLDEYQKDSHAMRHGLTDQLRQTIQNYRSTI